MKGPLPTKVIVPTERHQAFFHEFIALLDKHSGDLDSTIMLCLASQVVGQLAAHQDQRKYTPEMIMKLIDANINEGNMRAVATLMFAKPAGTG